MALAQAIGIWTADGAKVGSFGFGCVAAVSLAVGVVVRRPRVRTAAALLLALGAGGLSLATRLESAAAAVSLAGGARRLEATVAARSRVAGGYRLELVDAHAAAAEQPVPRRLRLFFEATPEGISPLERVGIGERLRVEVRIAALRYARNPGSIGTERTWQRRGFGVVARLAHPSLHVVRADRGGPTWRAALDAGRERIAARLERAGRGSELVRALSVGDRSGLTDETRRLFRGLGVSHLLAISGLHLGLVASLAFGVARSALRRQAHLAARWDTRPGALLLAVAVACSYALLAGWGVPVRRALVLLCALAASVVRSRPGTRAEPLAAAAAVILAGEPAALFEAGAQLSFAAAAAIAYSAPDVPGSAGAARGVAARGGRVWEALCAMLRASASALAVTGPIAAWHLGASAPFALLVNAIAVPWTGVVLLPVSILAASAAALGIDEPTQLSRLAAWIGHGTLEILGGLDDLLPSAPPFHRPDPRWLIAAAVPAAAALAARRTTRRVAGAIGVGIVISAAPPQAIEPPAPRLFVLEVGQGSAAVVQGREAAILIDAGPAWQTGDAGQRLVIPALGALGIERLDVLAVSHGDLDHRGGAVSILEQIPVEALWIPFGAGADPSFAALLAAARTRGVRIEERGAGSPTVTRGDLRIETFWPPRAIEHRSDNDASLVIRVGVDGRRVLVPGDVELEAEWELVDRGVELTAEILVLAHHGSRSSSSLAFLERVAAPVGIVSAPCRGRFEMPSAIVLEHARQAGMSVWWTGRDGAVAGSLSTPVAVWGLRTPIPGVPPYRCGR